MPGKAQNNPADNGGSNGTVAALTPAKQMRRVMELEATVVADNGNAAEEIQNAILAASSDEDVFGAAEAGLISGKELVGLPLAILDFELQRSTIADSSMPVYAKVKAINLRTGEPFVFSIGGDSSLAQLHRFGQIKPFDQRPNGLRCAIASKKTQAGFEVLWFRPLTDAEFKNAAIPTPAT